MDEPRYMDCDDNSMTLLGVRADGVAPIVDLIPMSGKWAVRSRADFLLREHASCEAVEVWCCGTMVDRLERTSVPAPAGCCGA